MKKCSTGQGYIQKEVTFYKIHSLYYKPAKVTSDFILNYLKKVIGGATTQKNLKTNTKTLISYIWICPQRPKGCRKKLQDPINTPFEVWCAKIALKLKNIGKTLRKQGFWHFFFNFDNFLKFVPFGGNHSTRTQQFYFIKKNLIFRHPVGHVHIDLNKNVVQTGCVLWLHGHVSYPFVFHQPVFKKVASAGLNSLRQKRC